MLRKTISFLSFLMFVALLIGGQTQSKADSIYAGAKVAAVGATPAFTLSLYCTTAYGPMYTYWGYFQTASVTYKAIVQSSVTDPVTHAKVVKGICANINDYSHVYYFRVDIQPNAANVGLKITPDTSSWNSAPAMATGTANYMIVW